MTHEQFLQWQNLIIDLAGLYILPEKSYLFETRLRPLLLERGLNLESLFEIISTDEDSPLIPLVIDLMTTHETVFFRDKGPFELFHHLIEQRLDSLRHSKDRKLLVLSAGCSSGEEPYSLAIVLDQVLHRFPLLRFTVHAYDIAGPTLERAKAGLYPGLEKTLEPALLARYFDQEPRGWRVKSELRARVQFEQRNLLKLESARAEFDFVFCRNVAIYFHPEARIRLLDQLLTHLRPDGILFVGASESLSHYRKVKRCEGPGGFYYRPH